MPEPLDPLERRVYHFLLDFLAEHTFQPSIREIGRRFRIGSTKTVADLLIRLEDKGYIERGAARSRGVRIVGYGAPLGTQPVPVYARAHAAPPTLRGEDVVRHYALDRRLLPSDDTFLVRVVGPAGVAHGVFDGDFAIVNPTARAIDDGLVALRLGEWIQVGAMSHSGSKIVHDTRVLGREDDYAVLGVVAGVVRAPLSTGV